MAKINKEKPVLPSGRYFEAVGGRKTSVARVRLFEEKNSSPNILVNNKPHTVYFPTAPLKKIAEEALRSARIENAYRVSAKISGGGIHSQAEALRHGISRAILKINPIGGKLPGQSFQIPVGSGGRCGEVPYRRPFSLA